MHGNTKPGFLLVLEDLESPGILLWHLLRLERPGKGPLVIESSRKLFNILGFLFSTG